MADSERQWTNWNPGQEKAPHESDRQKEARDRQQMCQNLDKMVEREGMKSGAMAGTAHLDHSREVQASMYQSMGAAPMNAAPAYPCAQAGMMQASPPGMSPMQLVSGGRSSAPLRMTGGGMPYMMPGCIPNSGMGQST